MTLNVMRIVSCSTNVVFPEGFQDCTEDANMMTYAEKLHSGYAQTKWVAEQLVLRAQHRGLPAAVYRYLTVSELFRLVASTDQNYGSWICIVGDTCSTPALCVCITALVVKLCFGRPSFQGLNCMLKGHHFKV